MNITPLNIGGAVTTLYPAPTNTSSGSSSTVTSTTAGSSAYQTSSAADTVEISAEAKALSVSYLGEGGTATLGDSPDTAALKGVIISEPLDIEPGPKTGSGDGGGSLKTLAEGETASSAFLGEGSSDPIDLDPGPKDIDDNGGGGGN